jgi:hypothetical protein
MNLLFLIAQMSLLHLTHPSQIHDKLVLTFTETELLFEDDSFLGCAPFGLVEVDRHFRAVYASIIALMMKAIYTPETTFYFKETMRRSYSYPPP